MLSVYALPGKRFARPDRYVKPFCVSIAREWIVWSVETRSPQDVVVAMLTQDSRLQLRSFSGTHAYLVTFMIRIAADQTMNSACADICPSVLAPMGGTPLFAVLEASKSQTLYLNPAQVQSMLCAPLCKSISALKIRCRAEAAN